MNPNDKIEGLIKEFKKKLLDEWVNQIDLDDIDKIESWLTATLSSLLRDTEREAKNWAQQYLDALKAFDEVKSFLIQQAKTEARAEIKEKISHLKRWVATIRDGENPACDEYVVRDKELKEILSALSKE